MNCKLWSSGALCSVLQTGSRILSVGQMMTSGFGSCPFQMNARPRAHGRKLDVVDHTALQSNRGTYVRVETSALFLAVDHMVQNSEVNCVGCMPMNEVMYAIMETQYRYRTGGDACSGPI
jgi:hypothetical protein